jgi:glycosyltransferase involved in cell wall biosynthesis
MNAAISVLVPTYNRAQFLPQCLASVFEQTLQPFEIIVIDDGSTDTTPELLRSYGDRIRYIRKPNGGKSSAMNLGLSAAMGDYVWIIDDDDVALPHALERLVAPLVADSALGMTFGGCTMAEMRTDGTLKMPGVERDMPAFPDHDLFLALLQHGCFLGQSAILARTSVYRQTGLFDVQLIRALDYDMALRLSRGCIAARVAGSMFVYRQHDGQRGSATEHFTIEERLAKWRAYGRMVVKKARNETRLEDYLSRQSRPRVMTPMLLRQAYLQRAAVMGRIALFPEMLEDLGSAMQIDPDHPLTPEERKLCDIDPINIHDEFWDRQLSRQLRQTCYSRSGLGIRLLLARKVYWRARYTLSKGRLWQSLRYLRTALSILGVGGLIKAIGYKSDKRKGIASDLSLDSANASLK